MDVATRAALEAGELLRRELHRPDGPRGAQAHAPADSEAEALIRQAMEDAFPKHGIVGEELGARDRPAQDEQSITTIQYPAREVAATMTLS